MTKHGLTRAFLDDVLAGPADGEGCILWPFSCTAGWQGGYPQIQINSKKFRCHIIVCEKFHGPRPKGKEVRHSCGVRACMAAWHVSWATHQENMADMAVHGTLGDRRGSNNSHWKGGPNRNGVRLK